MNSCLFRSARTNVLAHIEPIHLRTSRHPCREASRAPAGVFPPGELGLRFVPILSTNVSVSGTPQTPSGYMFRLSGMEDMGSASSVDTRNIHPQVIGEFILLSRIANFVCPSGLS